MWGRFLNADGIAGGNIFAYCENDPINRSDHSGMASTYGPTTSFDRAVQLGYDPRVATSAFGIEKTAAKIAAATAAAAKNIAAQKQAVQSKMSSTLTQAQKDFAYDVYTGAKSLEKSIGVPAAIVTGQAILESYWGESVPVDRFTGQCSYNIFGVKGLGPAGSVNCLTFENINTQIYADFEAYNSYAESVQGYKDFLTSKSMYSYDDLFWDMDLSHWAYGLESHGYATSPYYARDLLDVIHNFLGM